MADSDGSDRDGGIVGMDDFDLGASGGGNDSLAGWAGDKALPVQSGTFGDDSRALTSRWRGGGLKALQDAGKIMRRDTGKAAPCVTPDTRIATPRGEVALKNLRVGDKVITRDNGMQEIRWIGRRDMSAAEFVRAPHLAPVRICQGALDNDLPERDLILSPNQKVLVSNDKTALFFEQSEVLVAAKHLTGLGGVDVIRGRGTVYIYLMFDQHEVILSNGTWTESFHPAVHTQAGIGNAQRIELLEIFPGLGSLARTWGDAPMRRRVIAD